MRSVDTNVVVRFLTGDDPDQFAVAASIFAADRVFLPVTVVLETEWVLRDGYGYDPDGVSQALRAMMGMKNVVVEESVDVARAVELTATGLEFADAFHLARSGKCDDFVTFDRKFARRAARLDTIPVTLI